MEWTKEQKRDVWNKAKVISCDNREARKDTCGAWILWSEYGNRDSEFGWEIDHIEPESCGGSDQISNLRPLHWRNNASRGDGELIAVVKANGKKNINLDEVEPATE